MSSYSSIADEAVGRGIVEVTTVPPFPQPKSKLKKDHMWRWCIMRNGHWCQVKKYTGGGSRLVLCPTHKTEYEKMKRIRLRQQAAESISHINRADAKYGSLHKTRIVQPHPMYEDGIIANSWEQGMLMEENECPHNRLPGDSSPKCGCWGDQ